MNTMTDIQLPQQGIAWDQLEQELLRLQQSLWLREW